MLYSELRKKEVINTCDGSRLGNVVDLSFDAACGALEAIIVPGPGGGIFRPGNDILIPWKMIDKIGDDVILVHIQNIGGPAPRPGRHNRCGRV
nr:YlmC/YmxH family sporulation protein [Maliibacterium massiliense]